MLVGGGIRLAGNPGSYRGATGAYAVHRANAGQAGMNRAFWAGEGADSGKDGRPRGYLNPVSWCMPPKPGGMASYGLLVGVGSSAANLAGGRNGEAAIDGSGGLTADVIGSGVIVSAMAGSGAITAGITSLGSLASALAGTGSITDAAGNLSAQAVAALSGSGSITSAALSLVVGAAAALAGSGSLTSSITGGIGAQAALSGSGVVSEATIIGAGQVVAAMGGVGSITEADARALGNLMAGLVGVGTVTESDLRAVGRMSAAVTPFTDLSPQSLAAAVWNALATTHDATGSMGEKVNDAGSAGNPWATVLEGGLTAGELVRIISAVLAGKVSGASGSTITFRDVNDTKDRVVADVDGDGNRTDVTLDGS